jgi:hypothetical protein
MKPKTERNEEVYRKWRAGTSQFKLAIEFGVTPTNIARIIKNMKMAEATKQNG